MNSKILSVLVVDDELPIREELKLFDWESQGAVLVGDVSNGMKAISFCEEYTPDIVITDITMPVMDGLALTKEIKEKYPHVQVILLTCHSDFVYAREALQIGALDYLVKVTLEDEEVEKALMKARTYLEKEQIYQDRFNEEQRWKQSKLLTHFVNSEREDPKRFEQKLSTTGLHVMFPSRIVRLHSIIDQNNRIFVNREMQRFLTELERSQKLVCSWLPIGNGEFLFFFYGEMIDLDQLTSTIKMMMRQLSNEIEQNLFFLSEEVQMFTTISDQLHSIDDFKAEFLKVESWQKQRFYQHETELFVGEAPIMSKLTEQHVSEMEGVFQQMQGDLAKLVPFFREDFADWAKKHAIEPRALKELVLKWVLEWQRQWRMEGNEGLTERILHASTFSELLSLVIHALEAGNGKGYRTEIRQAIDIIKERVSQPITLSLIAEEVGLSSHYISRLFHEEVGISFNEFLTKFRMELAIQQLQTTNLKVYEVAEKVGIPSYRYFSAVFRKWTGMTPTEYKRG